MHYSNPNTTHEECYPLNQTYLVMEAYGIMYSGHFDLVSHILKDNEHLARLGSMKVGEVLSTNLDGYSLSIKRSPKGHYVFEPNDERTKGKYTLQFVDLHDYKQLYYLSNLLDAHRVIENINNIINLDEKTQLTFTSHLYNISLYARRKGNTIIFSGKMF